MQPDCNCCEGDSAEKDHSSPADLTIEIIVETIRSSLSPTCSGVSSGSHRSLLFRFSAASATKASRILMPVKMPTKCPPSKAAVRSWVCYLAIAGMFRRADSCLIHGRLAVLVLLFCPIQFDRQVRGRFSRGI